MNGDSPKNDWTIKREVTEEILNEVAEFLA